MDKFELHPRLEADSFLIGYGEECQIRLINDQRYPWIIIVPTINGVSELYQLNEKQRQYFHTFTDSLASTLSEGFSADKINIATIGNVVPQLHIHIIARFENDDAWPAPAWGNGEAIPYGDDVQFIIEKFITALNCSQQRD